MCIRDSSNTYPCYKMTEQALFNFQNLRNLDNDWSIQSKSGETIYFNLCHYTDTSDCGENNQDTFAYMTKGGSCSMLTSDTPQAEVTETVDRVYNDED